MSGKTRARPAYTARPRLRQPIAMALMVVIAVPAAPMTRADETGSNGTPRHAPLGRTAPDVPISLSFRDAELRLVLKAFARFTGLNLVTSDTVKGSVSLELRQVPWRQALETLLDAHGLAMRENGDVILIAPAQELAQRAQQRQTIRARGEEEETLRTQIFELRYQRAEVARSLLKGPDGKHLFSSRGALIADERSNRLFVTDTAARLARLASLLQAFDRPVRQVQIEARIVEAEDGFSRQMGARLGLGHTPGASAAAAGSAVDEAPKNGATETRAIGKHAFFKLPAAPIGGLDAAQAGLTLLRAGVGALLSLELSALEADGRGKVLSSPRVVTADRAPAVIEQGTELPYHSRAKRGESMVQFRKASLRLEVTPHILPGRRVGLDVRIHKDSVGMVTESGMAIDTKQLSTRVEIDDGGTVAIGGILQHDRRRDITRVPLLGELPLLGALFRRSAASERKSELVVFLTPTVLDSQDDPAHTQPGDPVPHKADGVAAERQARHGDIKTGVSPECAEAQKRAVSRLGAAARTEAVPRPGAGARMIDLLESRAKAGSEAVPRPSASAGRERMLEPRGQRGKEGCAQARANAAIEAVPGPRANAEAKLCPASVPGYESGGESSREWKAV